ncbi:MAG: glycosyltransferase family A protein [Gemmatimonadales bacterium]
MPTRPRVTIGVPVHNNERYLAETLESLLAQTFTDFELLICDNASTDGTGAIARGFAARDRRVRYLPSPRNVGIAGNFNRVVPLAGGEYCRWFAADDLAAPRSLERCVEVLDRRPEVVLTYPRTRLIDAFGESLGDYDDRLHVQSESPSERFRALLARVGLCNAFYGLTRTAVLRRTGLFGDYSGSDEVFQAELVLYGTFWEIPEVLFFRRMHSAAASAATPAGRRALYRPQWTHGTESREWRHLWGLMRAVQRAPIGSGEKLRLGVFLLRSVVWNRGRLARELRAALQHLIRSTRRPAGP